MLHASGNWKFSCGTLGSIQLDTTLIMHDKTLFVLRRLIPSLRLETSELPSLVVYFGLSLFGFLLRF